MAFIASVGKVADPRIGTKARQYGDVSMMIDSSKNLLGMTSSSARGQSGQQARITKCCSMQSTIAIPYDAATKVAAMVAEKRMSRVRLICTRACLIGPDMQWIPPAAVDGARKHRAGTSQASHSAHKHQGWSRLLIR
ncbi:hypothetical protein FH972_022744 [Carpinus fangiana]|uniref:Uncharacterized protein n=1 Tax=Carpinus fangiana TaxID=176857 RepID=A0A5N6KT52_9ROSI|nr:hypothetical protein FH972_022744 [Carpinus fangiana]